MRFSFAAPSLVCLALALPLTWHELQPPASALPGQLLSHPAASQVEFWQKGANGEGAWAPGPPGMMRPPLSLSKLPTQGGTLRPIRLRAWGHRDVVLAQPGEGVVSLPLAPWYLAALTAVWLGVLAFPAAHVALERRRDVVEQGAFQEKLRVEGVEPGQWVGPYKLERLLGHGSQAEVYLAHDETGLPVALKILSSQVSRDREFRIRFEREVAESLKFSHPGVVKTLRWSVFAGRLWMAQTCLPGGTLEEHLGAGQVSQARCLELLIGICEALVYVHARNIVHRDLKPANILLDEHGRPVLADFGMARARKYETITQTATVLGTPAYMAPEQGQGLKEEIGPVSDLYSLGVIAYELLSGTLPFSGDVVAVIIAHISTPVPSLRLRRPDLDPQLERVIEGLLQKQTTRRTPSATALLAQLRQIQLP